MMSRTTRTAHRLPCQYGNKCNEDRDTRELQSNHHKVAFALAENIESLFKKYGVQRIIFITLTIAEEGLDAAEVNRRWKSIRTGVFARRYTNWVCVAGISKNQRIHFHIVAVTKNDVRSGFDFRERHTRKKPSANVALRTEWSFWKTAPGEYGFGRTEAMPVRTPSALSRYLARHTLRRSPTLRGMRLVRYSRGWRPHGTQFSFANGKARAWRQAAADYFHRLSHADVCRIFGSKWACHFKAQIEARMVANAHFENLEVIP